MRGRRPETGRGFREELKAGPQPRLVTRAQMPGQLRAWADRTCGPREDVWTVFTTKTLEGF